jgi:DNA-directed RNA polymerase subunit RPC12/RpoP
MHIHDTRIYKCSECGSTWVESVTQGNLRFLRCRSCGHEGEKSEVVPTPKKSDLAQAYMRRAYDDVVRF